MQAAELAQNKYKDLLEIPPVKIWKPRGSYIAPRYIDIYKMPTIDQLNAPNNFTYIQVALEARARNPSQRILTSGEWYQIRKLLQKINPEVEESMVTGHTEMTSTFLDFTHGKIHDKKGYYDGHLIQIPEMDDNGNILTEKGILEFDKEGNPVPESGIMRATHVFKMALPLGHGPLKELHPRFNPTIDIIYGMKGAREKLPDSTYLDIESKGLKSLHRTDGVFKDPDNLRFDVCTDWWPLYYSCGVAARAAAEDNI